MNIIEIETHKEGTLQKLGTFTDNICFDMNGNILLFCLIYSELSIFLNNLYHFKN